MMRLLLLMLITCLASTGCKSHPQNGDRKNVQISTADSFLQTGWYYVSDTNTGYTRTLHQDTTSYAIYREPIVTVNHFSRQEVFEYSSGGVGLAIYFDNNGTAKWSDATEVAAGKLIGFILDNKLLCVSKVNGQVTGGVSALSLKNYSKADLEQLMQNLETQKANFQDR